MSKEGSKKYKLNIQFFGAESDVEKPQEEPEKEVTETPEKKEPEKKYSDEDLNNIIAKQKAKWEKDSEEKLSEAKKLAKMNAEEKAQYELQKKEEEIARREAEINRRELVAQAKEELANRDLPIELAEVLNYENADKVQESMGAVEKVFRGAVEKAVNEHLRGKAPSSPQGQTQKTVWETVADRYGQ